MKFHSIASFLHNGFKEWTTWIAILCIFLYIDFYHDIHYFVYSVVHSGKSVDTFLSWASDITITSLIAFLAFFKGTKRDDKQ